MIASAADNAVRYEFAMLEWLHDDPVMRGVVWGGLLLLVVASAALYWRERSSLRWGVAWWLAVLRFMALAAVAVMVLGPERRVAEVQTRASKVVVLVDTTLSMSLAESNQAGPEQASRLEAALASVRKSPLMAALAEQHEVDVRATDGGGRWRYRVDSGQEGLTEHRSMPEEAFRPVAGATRVGDAVSGVLDDYAGQPLAGVVLLSDGQSNAGKDPLIAAAAAKERGVPLHAIGFGPTKPGVNLAVSDLIAPTRAYPKDKIEITAVIEATGVSEPVEASLYHVRESSPDTQPELLATKSIQPKQQDDHLEAKQPLRQLSVAFTTEPQELGQHTYSVRLKAAKNEVGLEDNAREVSVEVLDRVLKVLLVTGGPSRDYRFLRDQLRRDEAFEVDVLLQSAASGAQQDADNLLTEFPASKEAIGAYDVILAFDPDWRRIGGDGQRLIEYAVSQRGAGLLYTPGPVHTPRWLGARGESRLKSLLPVAMPDRWLALSTSSEASRLRTPIELTPAGAEAEFLWIAGGRAESLDAWRAFPGFYRSFPVQKIKPGATVYARANRALGGDAALAGPTGVLLAEQFFGAGRVMVLTSSELWRLRRENPAYFTTLTTKMLQHLAQGRLLANSPEGSLLFGRTRYRVGDTVVLRATRVDAPQDQALVAEVIEPGGTVRRVDLLPSENQERAWSARWVATSVGDWRALVQRTNGGDLSAQAEVVLTAKERNALVRNERLLSQLTAAGGGNYYASTRAALNREGDLPSLADATPSQAEKTVVFGQPDPQFAKLVSQWALGLVAGCLILEWLTRRLNRLA